MIVRKRCPYTGVVNFYSDSEPHMALGSIAVMSRSQISNGYAWRSYSDDRGGGAALDFDVAERSLLQRIAQLDRSQAIVAGE